VLYKCSLIIIINTADRAVDDIINTQHRRSLHRANSQKLAVSRSHKLLITEKFLEPENEQIFAFRQLVQSQCK